FRHRDSLLPGTGKYRPSEYFSGRGGKGDGGSYGRPSGSGASGTGDFPNAGSGAGTPGENFRIGSGRNVAMAFGIDGKSEANALGRAVDMPEYKDSFRPAPLWERRTGTMKFQEIDVKNLQGNPWRVIGD